MTFLLPEQIAEMVERRAPRRSLLIRIDTLPTPTRFWTGVGPLTLAADDDLDPNERFRGSGVMKQLPSLRQVTDGKAERVEFEFFGGHPAVEALFTAGVVDVDVNVAYVFFNPDWSLAGPAAWLWQGVGDDPIWRQRGTSMRRVLSAVAGAASRRKAGRRYWTSAGHKSRHPGDLICDGMALMTVNNMRQWPGGASV